jgi:hypothetical protein
MSFDFKFKTNDKKIHLAIRKIKGQNSCIFDIFGVNIKSVTLNFVDLSTVKKFLAKLMTKYDEFSFGYDLRTVNNNDLLKYKKREIEKKIHEFYNSQNITIVQERNTYIFFDNDIEEKYKYQLCDSNYNNLDSLFYEKFLDMLFEEFLYDTNYKMSLFEKFDLNPASIEKYVSPIFLK